MTNPKSTKDLRASAKVAVINNLAWLEYIRGSILITMHFRMNQKYHESLNHIFLTFQDEDIIRDNQISIISHHFAKYFFKHYYSFSISLITNLIYYINPKLVLVHSNNVKKFKALKLLKHYKDELKPDTYNKLKLFVSDFNCLNSLRHVWCRPVIDIFNGVIESINKDYGLHTDN